MDLWNFGILPQHYTVLHTRRARLETSPLWKSQNSYHGTLHSVGETRNSIFNSLLHYFILLRSYFSNHSYELICWSAGPDEPSITSVPAFASSAIGSILDWNYTTEPSSQACLSTGGRCQWPRGKMVSGSSGKFPTNVFANRITFYGAREILFYLSLWISLKISLPANSFIFSCFRWPPVSRQPLRLILPSLITCNNLT
jgi:hypothetical protein